jgi:hypothetical protein
MYDFLPFYVVLVKTHKSNQTKVGLGSSKLLLRPQKARSIRYSPTLRTTANPSTTLAASATRCILPLPKT